MEPFEALVVQSQPYRETSVLLTLLTAEQGVMRALVKGAHRRGGVSPAALEPLTLIEGQVALRAPDALGTAANLLALQQWPALRRNPAAWAFASLGIEILWRIAAVSPPEPALFNEGCIYLEQLEQAAGSGSLTVLLLIRLLHWAGFPPQLSEDPTPGAHYIHDFSQHLIHPEASSNQSTRTSNSTQNPRGFQGARNQARHNYEISADLFDALRPLLASPPKLDPAYTLPQSLGRSALRWLIAVWEDHLNQPLASARYLESMVFTTPGTPPHSN